MDDVEVFGAVAATWRQETELLTRVLADLAAGRMEFDSDWAWLADQRAQLRQVRAHIEQARALIDDTNRTLADPAIWGPLTSPTFGAADRGSSRDAT